LSIGITQSPSAVILLSSGRPCCRFHVQWMAIACLCTFGMTCQAYQPQFENRPRTTIEKSQISDMPIGGCFYFAFLYSKESRQLMNFSALHYCLFFSFSLRPPPAQNS
jgi:hypothetical protein